jgi:hypothetical protein
MDGNGDQPATSQDLRSSLGFASSPQRIVMTPLADPSARPARAPTEGAQAVNPARRSRTRRRPVDEPASEGQVVIELLHALTDAVQRQADAIDALVERVDALSSEFEKTRGEEWDGWSVMASMADHLSSVESSLAELQARLEGATQPRRS